MDNDNKFYTCSNDRAFKEVFMKEENKDILIALLESILDIKIKDLEYLNLEKNVDNVKVRRKHFDLHVKTEKEDIQIEVNAQMNDYVRPRNAAFLFDTYSHFVKKGKQYDEDTLIIQINFTYGLEGSKYYTDKDNNINKFMLVNINYKPYIRNLELYEFNMDYFMDLWYSKSEKEIRKYKYLIMMNLGLDDLEKLSKGDKVVEKYMSEIERVNEDPEFREFISAEEDNLKIENSLKRQYREEARAEGLAEGREEGREEQNLENARKMLEKRIPLKDISDITGLSIEKINALKED